MTGPVTPILIRPDFETLFRPLVGAEIPLGELLLEAASNRIRRKFTQAGVELDESDAEVKLVIYEAVSAVLRHADFAGLSSVSFTTDDATEQRVFANALAQFDITDAQWVRLGLDAANLSASPAYCFPENDY